MQDLELGRKGTMKHKRQVRKLVERVNQGHKDDVFDKVAAGTTDQFGMCLRCVSWIESCDVQGSILLIFQSGLLQRHHGRARVKTRRVLACSDQSIMQGTILISIALTRAANVGR